MVMPLFALNAVPGDVAAAVGAPVFLGLTGACTALWRRANVLQDRHEAEKAALVERSILALERNTATLEALTREIRKAGA